MGVCRKDGPCRRRVYERSIPKFFDNVRKKILDYGVVLVYSSMDYIDYIGGQRYRLKDDMQRFFTKLMQKSFLAAYCNINRSV